MLVVAITTIAVVAFLILVNAVYVAAEFSTVSASRARLAQLADAGSAGARGVLDIVDSPHALDTYIAACQLGITVSSLVLGYYGQDNFLALVEPAIATLDPAWQVVIRSGAATAILLGLTVLQVLFGELMPKNVGVRFPERLAVALLAVMRWSILLFSPLIWFFNGSGRIVLRLLGRTPIAEHGHVHSPGEIVMLVEESSAGGKLDTSERRLLVNTLQLRQLTARKVMIPRPHMLAAPVTTPCADLFVLLAGSPYSRLPLYGDDIDQIVGVVHLKDLLRLYHAHTDGAPHLTTEDVRPLMRPVLHVPDSAPVETVMNAMQRGRYDVAIVVDEYGGTAGIITFEDLIEEIIGEFQDEFDVENPPLELRPNMRLRVRGDVLLDDLNSVLQTTLHADDVDTVGGLVVATLGRIPAVGDVAQVGDLAIRVDRVVNNGVATVSFPVDAAHADRLRRLQQDF
jgi:CBS domain containing-hemolysin-like protein